MLWYSTVIAVGLVALVWSADRFVDGASAIAKRAGLTPMLIGLTIVSVGTSAPEILISIMSALADSGELAVGNALGSNIANVGLVLGVTLLFSSIRLGRDTIWIDLPLLVLVVLVTWFLLYDLELSRSDSFVLLGMLALFFVRVGQHARQTDDGIEAREIPTLTLPLAWLSFIGGLILLIASSRLLVWAATHIATALGVSELVIGLTIVAVGTSLPELAASVMSALKGHADMAVGAIVGSNMFNILLVLAIPGLWDSLSLQSAVVSRDMVAVFLTTLVLALAALWRWNGASGSGTLGRGTGLLLLSLYIAYYGWLFLAP
ncbi:MAG: Inner membrane protein YrbG [Halieaceae bacterium]|nr:MAG: Inner membrane protein YrbG [Halieaceae bacterium]